MMMSTYDSWELIKSEEFDDYKSKGIFVRHKKTGMEVFHLLNEDEENLFAFGFKTLNASSDGAAHVLEHSVLCGSKRYPLKDPFMQLNSQSVKTFLNAMTFPDKTLYPASSMVKADYFNLMSVYGDAVFNPLLLPETFAQEAHRFEVDEKNNISVQGVVYNEMKGAYSSFDSIVADYAVRFSFPDTPYAFDSGGDPADIPSLTLEKLRTFHAEHYRASKCRLFLYGNIPTETQLDFIEDRFLLALQKPCFSSALTEDGNALPVSSSADLLEKSFYDCSFESPRRLKAVGPAVGGEKGATVLLNWVFGPSSNTFEYMEASFLSELLIGHDASPLTKALLESGLGEDTAPGCGLDGTLARLMFSCGMRGVKPENAAKVETCMLDVLSGIAKNGIKADDIKSALMSVDFSQREVQRSSGPWSLVLMRRAFRGWLNGSDPFSSLKTRAAFEKIKQRIGSSGSADYLQNLVQKLFLDNPHRLLLTVVPDKAYDEEREKSYAARNSSCALSIKEIKNAQKSLRAFQCANDESLRSLIPHLRPCELEKKIDCICTERKSIERIPVFVHNEAVNGIVYIIVAVPVDMLSAALYPFLPFYAQVLTNVGFNGMDWIQSATKIAQFTGGFGASVFTSSMTSWAHEQVRMLQDPLLGRDWLFFRVKTLAEYAEKGVDLLFDCFESPDFSDTKRIKDLAVEYRNDFMSSIVPVGHIYALSRCARFFNRSKAVDEIWSGLSQLYTAQRLASMSVDEIADCLHSIHLALKKSGMCVNITADKEGLKPVQTALGVRLKDYNAPVFSPLSSPLSFLPLTRIENFDENTARLSVYTAPSETGFAAACLPSSSFDSKEEVYQSLFSHWFTNNVLWEKIRTVGGAYGAFAFTDLLEHIFAFATYRDPDPVRSLDTCVQCLHKLSSEKISQAVLERAITGAYSKEVQPRSPSSRGFTGFMRSLYGIRDEDREKKLSLLLAAQVSDIRNAADFFAEQTVNIKKSVICGKYTDSTGIIIPLPL